MSGHPNKGAVTSVLDVVLRVVCYVLAGLTAWEAGRGWLRYRDRYRADILWVVGLLVAVLLFADQAASASARHPVIRAASTTLFLLQPYFLLRLVQRFRRLPRLLLRATGLLAFAAAATAAWTGTNQDAWLLVVAVYFTAQLTYAAWAFGQESRRAGGVTGARLWYASAGTWIHVAIAIIVAAEAGFQVFDVLGPQLRKVLGAGVFACYYAGLVAPRRLRAIWAQRELFAHVRTTADREPDARAREAPADLVRAVGRGLASVSHAVFLVDADRPGRLRVHSASGPEWNGIDISSTEGLVGTSLNQGTGVCGIPADCDPSLSTIAKGFGSCVWIVPLASTDRSWGVLVVIQRHGSLFPDDDLAFLDVLCKDTATSLEHGRLLAAERRHQKELAELRLRDSERRFGLMLNSIRDYAVLLLDEHGRIVAWKAGAESLFGYSEPDVVGHLAAPFFTKDDGAFAAILAEAKSAGHVTEDNRCRRQNGTLFAASTTIRPLVPDSGGMEGFVLVAHDETERRALGERLQQAQKMEAVGQLAGGVAHDFNNLLTAVLGYASSMQSHPGYDTALDLHLDEIRKVAERASGLTRRLLAFSRRQVVQPRLVNLPDTVAELTPMLERILEQRVTLEFTAETGEGWILADPVQLEQVVLNLAVNARDAVPEGGRVAIRTRVTRFGASRRVGDSMLAEGDYAVLTVADTGIGMDAATQDRMFEPFFTTKEVGRGTGLGLSTVYGIVKQIGGSITVESVLGKGTTFEIFLPATAALSETSEPPAVELADSPRRQVILLVEDEHPIRALVSSWLQNQGYTVIATAGSDEARRAMAGRRDIALIVTDVMMPGGNGPALVESLKRASPDLKALFISGYAHAALTTGGHLPPGTEVLPKPFTERDLIQSVRRVLRGTALGAPVKPQ